MADINEAANSLSPSTPSLSSGSSGVAPPVRAAETESNAAGGLVDDDEFAGKAVPTGTSSLVDRPKWKGPRAIGDRGTSMTVATGIVTLGIMTGTRDVTIVSSATDESTCMLQETSIMGVGSGCIVAVDGRRHISTSGAS